MVSQFYRQGALRHRMALELCCPQLLSWALFKSGELNRLLWSSNKEGALRGRESSTPCRPMRLFSTFSKTCFLRRNQSFHYCTSFLSDCFHHCRVLGSGVKGDLGTAAVAAEGLEPCPTESSSLTLNSSLWPAGSSGAFHSTEGHVARWAKTGECARVRVSEPNSGCKSSSSV